MDKLHRDNTTPEQSARLKELGVPEWTANLYYTRYNQDGTYWGKPHVANEENYYAMLRERAKFESAFYLPCWSAGRLLEIAHICDRVRIAYDYEYTLLENVLHMYELHAKDMDFSKLI